MRRPAIALLSLCWLAAPLGCGDDDPAGGGTPVDDAAGPGADAVGGEDAPVAEVPTATPDAEPEATTPANCVPEGALLTGRVYRDLDQSNHSIRAHAYDSGVDEPIVDVDVTLIGSDGERSSVTCGDGAYGFADLADGVYVVAPALDAGRCTTMNCARRFWSAVGEGHVKIVTIGDSVPVVGDPPMFPDLLKTLLEGVVEVESKNIAVGGTVSTSWLPDGTFFKGTLTPELPDTDVVLISLGGNDIMNYATNPANLSDIDAAIAGVKDLVVEVADRLHIIADAMLAVNPDLDIVYLLYPNYGQATATYPWSLAGTLLGEDTMIEVLSIARDAVPGESPIILVDMFGRAEGLPLDDYLYDALHFNHLGQVLYAEEIFRTLGGVLIGATPISDVGITPLGVEQSFALAP